MLAKKQALPDLGVCSPHLKPPASLPLYLQMWQFLKGLNERAFKFSTWSQVSHCLTGAPKPGAVKAGRGPPKGAAAELVGSQEAYGAGKQNWLTPARAHAHDNG